MVDPAVNPSGKAAGSRSISSTMLKGVQIRDPEAWVRLVDVWGPVIYGWCRRAGIPPSDADDIVQDVFMQVAKKVEEFERGTFRGWLWTITHRKIIDCFRDKKRVPRPVGGSDAMRQIKNLPDPDGLDAEEPSPLDSDCLIAHQVLNAIRNDFQDSTYQVFVRTAIQGESSARVAEDLGISKAAVRQNKCRVLRRLREELEGMLRTQVGSSPSDRP